MNRTIAVIGVPWSAHELVPAVRDAASLNARLCVIDTPQMLQRIDRSLDLDRIPVAVLSSAEAAAHLMSIKPDCVVSLTEMSMECAARVREALGHSGTSSAAEQAVTDKFLTRTILKAHDLTRVGFWRTTTRELESLLSTMKFPMILKPRALTGSTGVRLLRTVADGGKLESQYNPARASQFGRDDLLLETFVPGDEISVEAMAVNGQVTLLAVTDKVTTGPPHFFEVGHIMPSKYTGQWVPVILNYLQKCVDALDIVTSPLHAELKLFDGDMELIEIHSRFGGDNLVRLLEETLGLEPFACYFEAMLEGRSPRPRTAERVWGIGFFTANVGSPVMWRSFAFPNPDAVIEIDFDKRRSPKLEEYEGVRLLYWRSGQALFASNDYSAVYGNIAFMAQHIASETNLAGVGKQP